MSNGDEREGMFVPKEYLKHLQNENEFLEYLKEVDLEIANSSDRGIALICGSVIEELLSNLLKSFFVNSRTIDSDLFKGNGALSNFDSKIKIAFYLGLISKHELTNITYLQRIRNRFAHRIINISFDSNDISNMCSNFNIPKNCFLPENIPFPNKETGELPKVDLNPIKKSTNAKDRFKFTFKYLFVNLGFRSISGTFNKRTEYEEIDTAEDYLMKQNNRVVETLAEYGSLLNEKHELYRDRLDLIEEKLNKLETLQKTGNGQYDQEIEEDKEELSRIMREIDAGEESFEKTEKGLKYLLEINEYALKVIKNSMD